MKDVPTRTDQWMSGFRAARRYMPGAVARLFGITPAAARTWIDREFGSTRGPGEYRYLDHDDLLQWLLDHAREYGPVLWRLQWAIRIASAGQERRAIHGRSA